MNNKDLEKTMGALMQRSNPKYTSPTGAFLELLRDYAKNNEIEKIAESCKVYFDNSSLSKEFVSARIPGILVNHHFVIRPDLDYDKFILWSVGTEGWAQKIIDSSTDPNSLRDEVEQIIHRSNKYKA